MIQTIIHRVVTIRESTQYYPADSACRAFVSTRFEFLGEHGEVKMQVEGFCDGTQPAAREPKEEVGQ